MFSALYANLDGEGVPTVGRIRSETQSQLPRYDHPAPDPMAVRWDIVPFGTHIKQTYPRGCA